MTNSLSWLLLLLLWINDLVTYEFPNNPDQVGDHRDNEHNFGVALPRGELLRHHVPSEHQVSSKVDGHSEEKPRSAMNHCWRID